MATQQAHEFSWAFSAILRGEKVRTLISDRVPANTYTLEWDGKDDAGSSLASGTYFARLRIGAEVMQVRKLALVK